jgi:hypothetical protein
MEWLFRYFVLLPLMCALVFAGSGIKHSSSGTVVYAKWIKGEIIVAADSRGHGPEGYRDDECKITTYHNEAIFAFSGIRKFDISHTLIKWNAHELALKSFKLSRDQVGAGKKALSSAKIWKDEAYKTFQSAFELNPEGFMRLAKSQNGQICSAIFAVRDGNEFSFIVVEFVMNTSGKKPFIEGGIDPPFSEDGDVAMGQNSVIAEFFARPLNSSRAKIAYDSWKNSLPATATSQEYWESLCMQLIRWSIEFREDDTIGGDVNATVLDSRGIHWLTQTEYCQAANK